MDCQNKDEQAIDVIRKHWSSSAILMDIWRPLQSYICIKTDTWSPPERDKRELTEAELLPGELSADIIQVGCYTVRSAQRVYRIHEPSYSPELEILANHEEVELVRRKCIIGDPLSDNTRSVSLYVDGLRVVTEISAKHSSNPNSTFTYICRAAHARDYYWAEHIGAICTAKEYELIPDKYASLFVCNTFVGSSFSTETWYKLEPTGSITKLELHPSGSTEADVRFI